MYIQSVTVSRVPKASYHGNCRLFLRMIDLTTHETIYDSQAPLREHQYKYQPSVVDHIQLSITQPIKVSRDVLV